MFEHDNTEFAAEYADAFMNEGSTVADKLLLEKNNGESLTQEELASFAQKVIPLIKARQEKLDADATPVAVEEEQASEGNTEAPEAIEEAPSEEA